MQTRKTEILDSLTTLHAAFKRRDMDTIARFFADDVVFVTPDGEMRGKAARLADEQRIFEMFDSAEVEVTDVLVDGDEAAEFCILHGVARIGAGRRIALRYVVRYRFNGGLIASQEICFDREALRQQLGLAELV